ncbi:MAG: hypothetical protein ACHQ49_13675 [Elusimicrobiota bacterium]
MRVQKRLRVLARLVMRLPHNRPGTDKTFVHITAQQHYLHRKALRRG